MKKRKTDKRRTTKSGNTETLKVGCRWKPENIISARKRRKWANKSMKSRKKRRRKKEK